MAHTLGSLPTIRCRWRLVTCAQPQASRRCTLQAALQQLLTESLVPRARAPLCLARKVYSDCREQKLCAGATCSDHVSLL